MEGWEWRREVGDGDGGCGGGGGDVGEGVGRGIEKWDASGGRVGDMDVYGEEFVACEGSLSRRRVY